MKEPLKLDEIKPAAARMFKTADGKLVLEYLQRKFYDCKLSNDNILREAGARDVVKHILTMIEVD